MNRLTRWINKVTSPEGCTAVDARQLNNINAALAKENSQVKKEWESQCHAEWDSLNQLEALVRALDETDAIHKINLPKLTRAILKAKKHLGE